MSSPVANKTTTQGNRSSHIPSGGASQNQMISPPPPASIPSASPHNKADPFSSLDDIVDAFLSGPSARSQQNLQPLLRPPPLINEDPLQCLRTLVERRAWGDVLQVTAELLRGVDSAHAPCYSSLVDLLEADEPGDALTATIKEETVEIMALHCHALIKLRRYVELGKEIDKWMFLPIHEGYKKDCEAYSWVPWSLRKLLIPIDASLLLCSFC
jgi:hypothetical protein